MTPALPQAWGEGRGNPEPREVQDNHARVLGIRGNLVPEKNRMSISLIKSTKQILLNLFILILATVISPHDGATEEIDWKLMGETDNGSFLLYVNTKSITKAAGNIFTFSAKKEISREAFDEWVRRAEKESGGKVEDPDDLFKVITKSEANEFLYEIDCEKNEIKNIPLKTSRIHIINVSPILSNRTEEKIKKEFCKEK